MKLKSFIKIQCRIKSSIKRNCRGICNKNITYIRLALQLSVTLETVNYVLGFNKSQPWHVVLPRYRYCNHCYKLNSYVVLDNILKIKINTWVLCKFKLCTHVYVLYTMVDVLQVHLCLLHRKITGTFCFRKESQHYNKIILITCIYLCSLALMQFPHLKFTYVCFIFVDYNQTYLKCKSKYTE